uniref:Ig-like domain-containing protein n=1 Tax=Haplochromis burtoni TaxID=8153 RepID=A0A3Q2VZQ4_HAPBU
CDRRTRLVQSVGLCTGLDLWIEGKHWDPSVEGSSVTLTCSSDANPAANYIWYKEDDESPKASGQNFTITDIQPEHSGSYYCVAQNSRGHQNSILQLDVVAGQCATQTCILFVCLLFSEISNNREYHQVESGGSDADSFVFVEYTDKVIYISFSLIIILISLHQLDSHSVYENLSALKAFAASTDRQEGAGKSGVKSN